MSGRLIPVDERCARCRVAIGSFVTAQGDLVCTGCIRDALAKAEALLRRRWRVT